MCPVKSASLVGFKSPKYMHFEDLVSAIVSDLVGQTVVVQFQYRNKLKER